MFTTVVITAVSPTGQYGNSINFGVLALFMAGPMVSALNPYLPSIMLHAGNP